jgi:HlyD family secretion protein
MKLGQKFKSKWFWLVAVVVLVGVAILSRMTRGVEAEVFTVSRGQIVQKVEDTGEVVSQNQQIVYIEGSGKVIELKADVGATVKKGDLLLSLDKTELELQLGDAEAKVKAAEAQLASTGLSNYTGEIKLAQAKVEQAQLAFNSAERDYTKAQQLFAAQAISKAELEQAEDVFKAAQVSLQGAKLQLEEAQKGAPDHLIKGYKAQVEQAQLQQQVLMGNLEKQTLKSPTTGVILERLVEKDALVAPATPAFVIGSVEDLEIQGEILTDEIHKVKVGNQVEITGQPLNGEVLLGKVVEIAPAAKTVTSSLGVKQKRVPVTIVLTDGNPYLRPGYNVDLKIITAVAEKALVVPDSAVFDYQGKTQVFVVENGRAVLREVEKGLESDNFVEIKAGLKDGELVLSKPDNNIKEGIKIRPLATDGSDSAV